MNEFDQFSSILHWLFRLHSLKAYTSILIVDALENLKKTSLPIYNVDPEFYITTLFACNFIFNLLTKQHWSKLKIPTYTSPVFPPSRKGKLHREFTLNKSPSTQVYGWAIRLVQRCIVFENELLKTNQNNAILRQWAAIFILVMEARLMTSHLTNFHRYWIPKMVQCVAVDRHKPSNNTKGVSFHKLPTGPRWKKLRLAKIKRVNLPKE